MSKILIVEDSSAMRQLLVMAVRHFAEVEVHEASDGLAALKRLATTHYELMFVDLNMPMLDGMKLIKRAREAAQKSGQHCKICVVTTEAAQATEEQARSLGADFYLRKPVSRQDIGEVLGAVFAA